MGVEIPISQGSLSQESKGEAHVSVWNIFISTRIPSWVLITEFLWKMGKSGRFLVSWSF